MCKPAQIEEFHKAVASIAVWGKRQKDGTIWYGETTKVIAEWPEEIEVAGNIFQFEEIEVGSTYEDGSIHEVAVYL